MKLPGVGGSSATMRRTAPRRGGLAGSEPKSFPIQEASAGRWPGRRGFRARGANRVNSMAEPY